MASKVFCDYGRGRKRLRGGGTYASGKKDGKDNALCVWHDYVAGTDPTNANSRFVAKVDFVGGIPKVGWEPDLFFKVTVNMEDTPDTEVDLKFGDGSSSGYDCRGDS